MTYIADIAGERLDAFVARICPDLTRSAAQRLIEEGAVTRNGKNAKKNDKLNIGDEISVTIPEPKEVDIVAKEMPLDIVYQDEDVLVINKPKGLVVHPAAGHQDDTLVNGLLFAIRLLPTVSHSQNLPSARSLSQIASAFICAASPRAAT